MSFDMDRGEFDEWIESSDGRERIWAAYQDATKRADALGTERVRLRVFIIAACATLDRAAPTVAGAGEMRDHARALLAGTGGDDGGSD